MRKKLFGALSRYELGGRWGCRGDRDGEGDGDGEGEGDGDSEEIRGEIS
jgi:hypothetical protein